MNRSTWLATPLVFVSGACALVYQMVWTRALRLIFGGSTAASSAVIAIFIAGLGFGGLWWSRRADHSTRPLAFYGRLELAIAGWSALTPLLLAAVRGLYVLSGGSLLLGVAGSTVLRLLLSMLVLGPPTWLMGGTMPALARVVSAERDIPRRAVALVYGVNTLGALCGCALATFLLLETLGTRATLYSACLVNGCLGGLAWLFGRKLTSTPAPDALQPTAAESAPHGRVWILASAAVVGFAFFLMELVWYRMLAPLLGGSIFTFGLILCVALAGIGVGSALYAAFFATRRVTLLGFAFSCTLEAACLAAPYALGDRLVVWAALLRPLGNVGFVGFVFGWVLIACAVILPAALVSGWQFPWLIALLGSGQRQVARDVGRTYAANTLGAVAGALAGGFGLLSLLGALGCWTLVCVLLAAWGMVLVLVELRHARAWLLRVCVLAAALSTALFLRAEGPTAAFRHSPVGAGRVVLDVLDSPNGVHSFLTQQRRSFVWQSDGVESGIGLSRLDGFSFFVNGKSDGNARTDAATQVMGGLLGAALMPQVKHALVIGLGTGSTAGWLGQVPELERVDVAEIEPAIAQVARFCSPVNCDVLDNPKVNIQYGDARELLAVSRQRYDLIFSEPSNPYRAGVASLYTSEFYGAVAARLSDQGLFVQWLQAYDVDTNTLQSVYATLGAAFPHVETWNGLHQDLLLVASRAALVHDPAQLKARVESEPFASAMRVAWRTQGLEGFLAHFVANEDFTRACVSSKATRNSDDRSPVEFGFARFLGADAHGAADLMRQSVRRRSEQRPKLQGSGEGVDWARVDLERQAFAVTDHATPDLEDLTPQQRERLNMLAKWLQSDFSGALAIWNSLASADPGLLPIMIERTALAESLAYRGDATSESYIDKLLADHPTEALTLHAVWLSNHEQAAQAAPVLLQAVERYRSDPWPTPALMARSLRQVLFSRPNPPAESERWLGALSEPFSVRVNEAAREQSLVNLTVALGPEHPSCLKLLSVMEPYVPWQEAALSWRAECYAAHRHALAAEAKADLAHFQSNTQTSFDKLLAQ